MRRLAVLPAAVALMTAVAPPSTAGRLQRVQSTIDDFSCAFATREGPTIYLFGSASELGSGSGAFVEGEQGVILEGSEGTASFQAGQLSASVVLRSVPDGEPIGRLEVSAGFTVGQPQVEDVDERSGNAWTRGTRTTSEFTFRDVTVAAPGLTPIVTETPCSGQRTTFDVRSTDPAARVYRDSELAGQVCAVDGIPDAQLLLGGRQRAPFLEVVIGAASEDPRKAQGLLHRAGDSWRGSLPLVALATGETLGPLDVSLDLTSSGRPERLREASGRLTEMTWRVPYSATFELRTPDGGVGRATCPVVALRSHVVIAPQAPPSS